MMKNRNKKYILLFVILYAVFMLFPLLQEIYLTKIYGADIPIIIRSQWKMLYGLIIFLPNVAAAFWLRHLAKREEAGAFLWFFFGLVGGLVAVGIFYLISIHEKLETQQANQPDRE
jgi:hypothetical protein